jgi:hypothetical protein
VSKRAFDKIAAGLIEAREFAMARLANYRPPLDGLENLKSQSEPRVLCGDLKSRFLKDPA